MKHPARTNPCGVCEVASRSVPTPDFVGGRAKCPSDQCQGQRPQGPEGLLANGEEPTEVTPRIVTPVEAEVSLRTVAAEDGHAAITKPVDQGRAEGDDRELPLDIGVLRPERQKLLNGRGTQAVRIEVRLDLVRVRHLVQVDELQIGLDDALALDGEALLGDVVVLPVVLTGLHHLRELQPVVDGHEVLRRLPVGVPLGVPQERLQELPGDTTRLVLGEQLGDLVGGDSVVHLLLPCICRQTALHPTPCRAYYCQYRTDTVRDWRKSPAFFCCT